MQFNLYKNCKINGTERGISISPGKASGAIYASGMNNNCNCEYEKREREKVEWWMYRNILSGLLQTRKCTSVCYTCFSRNCYIRIVRKIWKVWAFLCSTFNVEYAFAIDNTSDTYIVETKAKRKLQKDSYQGGIRLTRFIAAMSLMQNINIKYSKKMTSYATKKKREADISHVKITICNIRAIHMFLM